MPYKSDQGRYVRMGAFWLLFLLAAYGLLGGFIHTLNAWLGKGGWLSGLGVDTTPWSEQIPLLGKFGVATLIALIVLALVALVLYRLLSRPRTADYLIETESEMRKVVWPSWKDTRSGSMAVIITVVILLLYLLAVDALFLEGFSRLFSYRITGS